MKRTLTIGVCALALVGFAGVAATGIAADSAGKRMTEDYVRVPMPPGVQVLNSELEGPVFADAAGHTLYIWPLTSLRVGFAGEGKNKVGCTDEVAKVTGGMMSPYPPGLGLPDLDKRRSCTQEWPPLFAADDAKPVGSWTILKRDDGKKQWAYQGYALWTYDGDKRPGDINGNDSFTYAFSDMPGMTSDAPRKSFDFGTPMDGAPALYWAIAIP